MQETIDQPLTVSVETGSLVTAAARAAEWAGEPFLHPDEDVAQVLTPGTARRRALDDAIAEIELGNARPSSEWKIRYSLMLGLERVLSERPPHLKSGTELRRHQVDALAGMLTELIAAAQREPEAVEEPEDDFEEEEDYENGDGAENGEALEGEVLDEAEEDELPAASDPGAVRRYRFRHPTASGKTIAAAGFVEAASTIGVLILTHRRLLVSQFNRELKDEGYGDRITPEITGKDRPPSNNPITIQTYAWFARHVGDLNRDAYQLVICDEAHTALGEKTSAAIRSFPEPVYIGMTATEQLIAKQVSDVFPASVDDLPLGDAARRGLIAPLRCLRVPPAAAINSVPIVGGDFDQEALAKVLDHHALNQAAASLYRDRFDSTPGIVYAAGVEHAYNLATEFRSAGLKAEAVSGRTPPVKLAEILAAYERGEIDVLVNAMLLAEGWNSPRATVVHAPRSDREPPCLPAADRPDHAPAHRARRPASSSTSSRRARRTRIVWSRSTRCSAPISTARARASPLPRAAASSAGRAASSSRRPWLVPVTPDVNRRLAVIQREWQRVDPRYLDEEEQRFWARIAGRQARFDDRVALFEKLTARASKAALEQFLFTCAAENPNRRLRMMALADRVGMTVDRASFDDLVTLVTQAPPWEKDRVQGVRTLLRAIGEGRPDAPDQILARWTWRLARAVRKVLDRKASAEYPEAKRLLGALANSRGHRHEENAAKLAAGGEGAAARDRRCAARLRRGLHAAVKPDARGCARGARLHPGGRERAGRGPARAEGESGPAPAAAPEEEAGERERAGSAAERRGARAGPRGEAGARAGRRRKHGRVTNAPLG